MWKLKNALKFTRLMNPFMIFFIFLIFVLCNPANCKLVLSDNKQDILHCTKDSLFMYSAWEKDFRL